MKFKYILISVLVSVLVIPFNVAAVNVAFSQRLKNITQYLNSFVDLDSSLNYWSDSLKNNPCIKRDVMSLHAQKDEISNRMLAEYTSLSDSELDILKRDYALLDSELTFVRNALKPLDKLQEIVAKRANKNVRSLVTDDYLPQWINGDYAEKIGEAGEYNTCPKAWDEVVQNWKSLSENIEAIKTESKAFSKQFTATVNEASKFPESTYRGIGESYRNTRDGLKESLSESLSNAQETLARNGVNQSSYYQDLQAEYAANNNQEGVSTAIESGADLTSIPGFLSQSDEQTELILDEGLGNAKVDLLARYNDSLTLKLWATNEEINQSLKGCNILLGNETGGIVTLSEEIKDKQCR